MKQISLLEYRKLRLRLMQMRAHILLCHDTKNHGRVDEVKRLTYRGMPGLGECELVRKGCK